ncbi:hypothetical protein [Streptomyces sp. NBC_01497]|uniref:hypothetical protein n=1 Tax=Streptomyces sp. NBC_01497 TaxID=2903885 RepID=UPI002E35F9BF|nr:hypothetical protein [Streptomyces sp. NBC_01497]
MTSTDHVRAVATGTGDLSRPRAFSAGWATKDTLDVTLVLPELVVEVRADIARDSAGRWRHPVRLARFRDDLAPSDVPLFDADDDTPAD